MIEIEILDLIGRLKEIRKIPQFLFLENIHHGSMFNVRNEILDFKKENQSIDEIDFIIHSPGGSPSDAYRIIRTLRNNFDKVNIIVPFWAKSAATLLSLGGSQIIMDEFGEFGPLDIQIGVEREDSPELERESALIDEYSVKGIETRSLELYFQMFMNLYKSDDIKINKNELSKHILDYLASFYKPLLSQINPYRLGNKKRKLEIGKAYAERILNEYNSELSERNSMLLVDFLVNGCPDHGYVIDYNLISKILKNVKLSSDISEEYKEVLSNLSTNLFKIHEFDFVGFVYTKEELENREKPPLEDQEDSVSLQSKKVKTIKTKALQNGTN